MMIPRFSDSNGRFLRKKKSSMWDPAGDPKSLTTAAQSKRAVTGSLLHDVFRQLHVLKPRFIWLSTPKNDGVKVTWDDEIPNMGK